MPLADGAWLDYVPGWVRGHQTLMTDIVESTRWQSERREMYERMVDVPRLLARIPRDRSEHPLFAHMRQALAQRYAIELPSVTLALYRDGRDSVAFHGDRVARELPEAIVATVSLGEPRRFLLRRKSGGESRAFSLGWGDLLVMGGTCQRTWQHGIPKVAHAGRRMVIMFRPSWYEEP
jgi:alkylated DNA repair dioxygenase AlkB